MLAAMDCDTPSVPRERLYQVDALRVLSMFFVCILHAGGGYGGLSAADTVWDKGLVLLILAIADVGVNCFMMITGYVSWGKEWKLGRYVALWAQVAFYTVGFVVVAAVVNMATQGNAGIAWSQLSSLFLPVPFASAYWYFTVYTSVFLLSPAMSLLQARLNQKQFFTFILVCMALVSVFAPLASGRANWGYSTAWLCIMYMAGSYLREYPVKVNCAMGWICILLGAIASAGSFAGSVWLAKHGLHIPFSPFSYSFPIVAVESVLLFLMFANLEVKSRFACRIISVFTPVSFGVYLVHCHPCAEPYFRRLYSSLSGMLPCSSLCIIVVSLLIYAATSMLDGGRLQLFRVLRVRQWSDKTGAWLTLRARNTAEWLIRSTTK